LFPAQIDALLDSFDAEFGAAITALDASSTAMSETEAESFVASSA
jgi:hypothetical protein